jgi:hypothetical protein
MSGGERFLPSPYKVNDSCYPGKNNQNKYRIPKNRDQFSGIEQEKQGIQKVGCIWRNSERGSDLTLGKGIIIKLG